MKRHIVRDRHHRLPRSRGGTNTPENISLVPQNLHRAYHTLFGNMMPDTIAKLLTDTWIAKSHYLIAVPYKKRKPLVINRGNVRILLRVYENGKSKWAEAKTQLKERRK